MKLEEKTTEQLVTEIKSLRKKVRTWQKIVDWDGMALHYGSNCSNVNLGKRPRYPKYI